jgi:hypothetical protein
MIFAMAGNFIHEVISTEWLTSLSTSIKLKYCVIKRISHYSIDAPGQLLKVNVAYWAQTEINENETKRNQQKRNETKRNQRNENEIKRNQRKQNEINENETK